MVRFTMKKIGNTLLGAIKEHKIKKKEYAELERRILARRAEEAYAKQLLEERKIRLSEGLREEMRALIQAEIDKQMALF